MQITTYNVVWIFTAFKTITRKPFWFIVTEVVKQDLCIKSKVLLLSSHFVFLLFLILSKVLNNHVLF